MIFRAALILASILLLPSSLASWSHDPIFRTVQRGKDSIMIGSAFVVPGTNSLLLTAAHNVRDAREIELRGFDRPVLVTKRGTEKTFDAAVLLAPDRVVDFNDHRWAEELPKIGEEVRIIGYPGSILDIFHTPGVIISTDLDAWVKVVKGKFITLAAPSILKGQSGSPVFNSEDEIVGMLVKGYTDGGTVSLAIPSDELREFIED